MNKTPIYIEADVAVIGGGLAGMCAAIAAARGGAKVVLVQNRPVLGGNQSSEMKVGISGADCSGYAFTQYTRETGILDEIMMEHLHDTPDYYNGYYKQDVLFWKKVTAEKNIRLLLNTSSAKVGTCIFCAYFM